MVRSLIVTSGLLFTLLGTVVPARADDAVLEWNQIALAATAAAGQGPLPQLRSMAIVQASVHDAVNAITCEYHTYLSIGCGPWGSPEAAAIAAAHYALTGLFPAQAEALNSARAASLATRGLPETDSGIEFGEAVAAVVLALRAGDGSAQAQFPYTASGAGNPGIWVAVGAAPPVLPGWGNVTPWVLRNLGQFQPDAPPPLHSRRYARDYNEVKEIGSLNSLTRTDEQTEIARFWLGTAGGNLERGRAPADPGPRARYVGERTRAGTDLPGLADAGIACWKAKYIFNFWRPITAIHNGDLDENARTDADPDWMPLFATPQHPEYISGHSTTSSAIAMALTMLFGDGGGMPIIATSPTNPGFERHWPSLSDGVEEVIDAPNLFGHSLSFVRRGREPGWAAGSDGSSSTTPCASAARRGT